jgi:hypothetical protein
MAALVEMHAFGLQEQALQVGLLYYYPPGRYAALRIDYSVPRYVAPVLWRRVHGPAYEPWAVAVFQQSRDLPVCHNAAARDATNHTIYLFKDLSVFIGLCRASIRECISDCLPFRVHSSNSARQKELAAYYAVIEKQPQPPRRPPIVTWL